MLFRSLRAEPAPPLPPAEEEEAARAGPARLSCAGSAGRACGAGRRRGGGYSAAACPSPAPSPSPPPDSGPRTRTSEARGGRTGRTGPRRGRSEHTHALAQAVKPIKAPGPAPSTTAGAPRAARGSPGAPPSSLPTPQCQLQPCSTGRGGEEAAADAPPSPARLSRAPAAAEGSAQSCCAKKGKSEPAPASRPPPWSSGLFARFGSRAPGSPAIKGGGARLW